MLWEWAGLGKACGLDFSPRPVSAQMRPFLPSENGKDALNSSGSFRTCLGGRCARFWGSPEGRRERDFRVSGSAFRVCSGTEVLHFAVLYLLIYLNRHKTPQICHLSLTDKVLPTSLASQLLHSCFIIQQTHTFCQGNHKQTSPSGTQKYNWDTTTK